MNMPPFFSPARSGSYSSFRDEAVARRAGLRRLKRKVFLAALVLSATGLSATTETSLLSSPVAGPTQNAACVEAGQRLSPWFKAEAGRKALVGLNERDDFNLLLTWFHNAQAQCTSGETDRAVENLQAVESMIAERAEQHQPEPEDE